MSAQSDMNEQLSALLDGELQGAELDRLLEALESSPELNARWQRLCAVQSARKGVRLMPKVDITAGVLSAIADAPVPARDTRVVPMPQQPARRRARREWLPAVGIAAAASVAAVVAVGTYRGHVPAAAVGQAVALAPAAPGAQPVAAALADSVQLNAVAARQLDNLMIEHANYRGGGVGGALGYARVAAHTADYQIDDGRN